MAVYIDCNPSYPFIVLIDSKKPIVIGVGVSLAVLIVCLIGYMVKKRKSLKYIPSSNMEVGYNTLDDKMDVNDFL